MQKPSKLLRINRLTTIRHNFLRKSFSNNRNLSWVNKSIQLNSIKTTSHIPLKFIPRIDQPLQWLKWMALTITVKLICSFWLRKVSILLEFKWNRIRVLLILETFKVNNKTQIMYKICLRNTWAHKILITNL